MRSKSVIAVVVAVLLALLIAALPLASCRAPAPTPTPTPTKAPTPTPTMAAPGPTPTATPTKVPPTPMPTPTAVPPPTPTKPKEYVIGWEQPLTGPAGYWGEVMRNATILAVEEINAAGGIDGVPLRIIYEDNQALARPGVEVTTKLIEVDKVPVVMSSGSSVIPAIRPMTEEKKVVLFNNAARLFQKEYEGNKYFFGNIMTREQEAGAMVELAHKLGHKTAVMIYSNDAWGQGMQTVVKKQWEEKGYKLLLNESYEADQKDFRTTLLKMKTANPDVFFELVYSWQAGALVLQQAGEVGWKPKFVIGPDMLIAPELPKQAGAMAEGIVAVSAAWNPYDMSNTKMVAFKTKYMQRYAGTDPTGFGATTYDAVYMLADAIRRGGYTADGIAGALRSLKGFNGVCGTNISIDPVLGRPIKDVAYVTVSKGEYTTYTPAK